METFTALIDMLTQPNSELRQIIGVTLRMSFTSTLISCTVGILLGVLVGISRFPGKRLVMRTTHTLMGLPPVLSGLLVFFLLSRSGPLGQYKLLYSVTAMVVAQVLLITPIALGLSASFVSGRVGQMEETVKGLGLSKFQYLRYMIYECRAQLFSVFFTGFGRAISEVGAAQLVGGNVQYKTRVMTTAIVLETNMGHFEMALALGITLLVIAFIITSLAQLFQEVGGT